MRQHPRFRRVAAPRRVGRSRNAACREMNDDRRPAVYRWGWTGGPSSKARSPSPRLGQCCLPRMRPACLISTPPSLLLAISMPVGWAAASARIALQEGKTDARAVAAISRPSMVWPTGNGRPRSTALPTDLALSRQPHRRAARPRRRRRHHGRWRWPDHRAERRHAAFAVQPALSTRASAPDRVHMPVYVGLGNHDLDQNGSPPHVDWYRRELRDYVEVNHRPGVFFKPPVPATEIRCRYPTATPGTGPACIWSRRTALPATPATAAVSSLPWLKQDLATYAADGRPVILFQHYGWDTFSVERWDPGQAHL